LNRIFSSNLLDDVQLRDDTAASDAIIAKIKEQHPTVNFKMLPNYVQGFKSCTFQHTVTFASFPENILRFAFGFAFVISHGRYPSLVQHIQFRRNLLDLKNLQVVHIKQAMQEDLIKILHPIAYLNVIGNIRHEHPMLLEDLNLYFTTENKGNEKVYKAAHYFVKIEDYHRFVYGTYDAVEQERPTDDQFKEVHPILLSYMIILFLSP
jgi:hypothetical protein